MREDDGLSQPGTEETGMEYKKTGLEIAVIGMSGRFPGAGNIDEFWLNLIDGVESVSFYTDEELEKAGVDTGILNNPDYVNTYGGVLEGREYFDAFFFDYIPDEAEVMDPQLRLFHQGAWEALEHAGYAPGNYDGPIGVYAGAGSTTAWETLNLLSGKTASTNEFAVKHLLDREYLCTRVSYKLDLKGPSFLVQTACSTSLVAIHLACQGILSGECDIAIAGGVCISIGTQTGYLYREGMVFSRDGHCRAFDAKATGTIAGQGVGIVVLKALEEALADRDYIHAVVKGTAINNDGSNKVGYTAPGVKGQVKVIQAAMAAAEVEPETIGYVETHGTGTVLGDPVEIEALTQVFDTAGKNTCAIGSVKTNFGHLDAAAGVAGFIKTVLTLEHKQIPPSLHFETPNPAIDFSNSPFYVNTQPGEWKNEHRPLRAGVSSFGIGGTNAHAILEEAPVIKRDPESRTWKLIVLSAKTPTALEKAAQNLCRYLQHNPAIDLADAAYTLQVGRTPFPYRKMLVAADAEEVTAALSDPASPKVKTLYTKDENRPVVFMFSGQGFHYLNMGLELYRSEPCFRRTIDRCAEILEPILGTDIREVMLPAEETQAAKDRLEQIEILQPLTFSFQYALSSLLTEWGVTPDIVIGHSFGEYAAACTAGIFSLEDALKLAVQRGRSMQTLPSGSMLAVSLAEEAIKPFLEDEVTIAAVNSCEHCLVSGPPHRIDALAGELENKGHNCRKLHIPLAGHSEAMDPILPHILNTAKQIRLNKPRIPMISGLTGERLTDTEAVDPGYWAKQLRHTVRFNDGISLLLEKHAKIFVEIGPGSALCTFLKQNKNFTDGHFVLNVSKHPLEEFPADYFFIEKLGHIWLWGGPTDWQAFHAGEKRGRIPLPTYPFEGERYWPDDYDFNRYKAIERFLSGGQLPEDFPGPGSDSVRRSDTLASAPVNLDRGAAHRSAITPGTTSRSAKKRLRPELGTAYAEPCNDTERILADMWQNFFGIEKIGIYDSFFDLGGDSLKMVTISARIHKKLGVKIPAAEFFKMPTIHQLAGYINGIAGSLFTDIEAVPQQEYYDLSPGQERLWRICQSTGASRSYNMLFAGKFKGRFDIEAMNNALSILIERHESLRTGFIAVNGVPKQIVLERVPFSIVEEALAAGSRELPSLFQDFATAVFDLANAPLFNIKIVKLEDDLYMLLLNMHHIIGDGWSVNVFARELAALYNACLRSGSPSPQDTARLLKPLRIQYKDYALWHRRILQDEKTAKIKEYWLETFSGELPESNFPTDFPRPQVKTYNGKIIQKTLGSELVSGLKRLCDQQGVTLYMTLLAAVKLLIRNYTGQEDIITGTQTAGRIHPDLENQVGYYVNLLPLRDRINGDDSFVQFLQQVKQTAADAYDNQIYPFDHLVEALNLSKDTGRHPLFDIMVDVQNLSRARLEFEGLEMLPLEPAIFEHRYTTSKFDLTITFVEQDDEISMIIEYDTDLFMEDRIQKIFDSFIQLLKSIMRAPGKAVKEIGLRH
jgi:acyl transferase domain-containing protein